MFRTFSWIICMLIPLGAFAQLEGWLYFSAKPEAVNQLADPQHFLSQRALERRLANQIDLNHQDAPIHQPYLQAVTEIESVEILAKSKWLNAIYIQFSPEVSAQLLALDGVEKLQLADHSVMIPEQQSVNSSVDEATYGGSWTAMQQLNLTALHQNNFTGQAVLIGVIDNGFQQLDTLSGFQSLFQDNRIADTYNFVHRNTQVYEQGAHGTMVLSVLGANSPSVLVGGAFDATYALYVTEDTTREMPVETAHWIEAAERADSLGVDLLTTSLGYAFFDNSAYDFSYSMLDGQQVAMSRAAQIAASKGIIVINSAGNSGATDSPWISAASDAVDVLAVGAVNADNARAGFSSIGFTADGRVKPDLMALGVANPVYTPSGEIQYVNGTSFSAPWIAAGFACLRQALPTATAAQLKEWVLASASQFVAPDQFMGYGIPDFGLAYQLGQEALQVADFEISNQWKIAPNPIQDFFVVQSNEEQFFQLTIYDAIGRVIYHTKDGQSAMQISAAHWPSGIYFAQLQSQQANQLIQLIK